MRGPSCESDLTFDLLLAGDLTEPDERRVRDHLGACAACATRRAEIVARRAAFEAAPRAIALGERLAQAPRGRRRLVGGAAALAAAAVVLLLVLPDRGDPVPPPATARTKGGETFQLYIRHGARVRKAGHAEVVHPSDQLQFVYSSRSPGYAAVLSRDGDGVVSVYFPDGGTIAAPVPTGLAQLLPSSTILDETLGGERVFALLCASPIDLEPLRLELAAGRAPAPPGCAVRRIDLDKRGAE
jgi:hypothetical protein